VRKDSDVYLAIIWRRFVEHVKRLVFVQFYERFCSDILGVIVMAACLSMASAMPICEV